MLNRINRSNPLNGATPAIPALETPAGWEGAALARLGQAGLAGHQLAGLDQNHVDPSQGGLALENMLSWLGGGQSNGNSNWQGGSPAAGNAAAPASGVGSAPGAGASSPTKGQMQSNKTDGEEAQGGEGEWGPDDEKFLEQDVQESHSGGASPGAGGKSHDFEELFNDFGQTSEGNCASVAVIKAAMDKYGTKVFSSVTKSGDGFQVKQQDGKTVSVSSGELKQAAQAAKLKGKPSAAKSQAILMYAIIGKNKGGVEQLGQGADPKDIAQSLGLGSKMKDVSPQEAGNAKEGAVCWSGSHAVYCEHGKTDHYGKAQQFDDTDGNGQQLQQGFEFV